MIVWQFFFVFYMVVLGKRIPVTLHWWFLHVHWTLAKNAFWKLPRPRMSSLLKLTYTCAPECKENVDLLWSGELWRRITAANCGWTVTRSILFICGFFCRTHAGWIMCGKYFPGCSAQNKTNRSDLWGPALFALTWISRPSSSCRTHMYT